MIKKSVLMRIKLAGHLGLFILRIMFSRVFQPVLIYSMAKSGTTSVKASLRRTLILRPVFHIHHLSREYTRLMSGVKSNGGTATALEETTRLRAFIEQTRGKKRWKVVCLTREPVAREISTVFQTIENKGLTQLSEQELYEKALSIFNQEVDYKSHFGNFWNSISWFDQELREVFGFDALQAPFDHAAGYSIYATQDADILIIRVEDLTRCAAQAFEQFLGLKNFRLLKVNESSDKVGKSVYQRVKASITVSGELLDRYYTSRYAQHFYTQDEIRSFKKQWMVKDAVN